MITRAAAIAAAWLWSFGSISSHRCQHKHNTREHIKQSFNDADQCRIFCFHSFIFIWVVITAVDVSACHVFDSEKNKMDSNVFLRCDRVNRAILSSDEPIYFCPWTNLCRPINSSLRHLCTSYTQNDKFQPVPRLSSACYWLLATYSGVTSRALRTFQVMASISPTKLLLMHLHCCVESDN